MRTTPVPTMRRLPHYLHLLNRQFENGVQRISSTIIANELSLDSTQVRKDLEYTGVKGKPKTGFQVEELISAIRKFLEWDTPREAVLVGVGNLGRAMLGYERFKNYGLNFIAAFDTDPAKVGTEIFGIKIHDIDNIPQLMKEMKIKISVLTVPANSAQEVVDLLIEGGVTAIWNFAPINIRVPKSIVVENAQFTESLASLSRKLIEVNYTFEK
ncbi:MAG: redox-sensing transcriptional repressor Rex [Melioribacteraceae bacterium]|nr:redox-sensing transcriptional repressor Rex [Melioribacteraceae bacterium]